MPLPTDISLAADVATFIDELAADASKHCVRGLRHSRWASQQRQCHRGPDRDGTRGRCRTGSQGGALTETTGADTAGVDIVFGDAAGTDDLARDANHSSRSAYRVVSAALSVAKISTLICDPFNGTTNPKHIPGAIVRWTITITNTGAASASLSTVADAINALTTFDANLVTGAGGAARIA